MDAPVTGESIDQVQPTAADFLRSSRAYLAFKPGALVDDLAADDLVVDVKSEDDLASAVDQGIAHELRDHQGQLAQPFWIDVPGEISLRRGASQTRSGRIGWQVECKVGGHQIPMREKGRR
jgi:hypothetical protein